MVRVRVYVSISNVHVLMCLLCYSGKPLLEMLDTMPMMDRKINGPVMMPISEKYKDMGTVIVGKLESGRIHKNDTLVLMPNRVSSVPSVTHANLCTTQ
jgi:peptide chain release factor subunit 3